MSRRLFVFAICALVDAPMLSSRVIYWIGFGTFSSSTLRRMRRLRKLCRELMWDCMQRVSRQRSRPPRRSAQNYSSVEYNGIINDLGGIQT